VVLLCDADDVVDPGWISALSAALDDTDLVGGRLEYEVLNDAASRESRDLIQTSSLSTPMGGLTFSSSANFGLHRSVFDSLGGFDPAMSETDFCWRAQHAGFSLRFAPDAIVHYRLRAAWRDVRRQASGYTRSREALYAKHRRMGYLSVPPVSRYKVAAYRASRVVTGLPSLLSSRRRLRYARDLGRATGTAHGFAGNRFLFGDRALRRTSDRIVARDQYLEHGRLAVPGWFRQTDARLFVLADEAQRRLAIPGDVIEIGAYLGRSTILLGFLHRRGERLVVVDPFETADAKDLASWALRGRRPPTQQAFEGNILRHHAALPEMHVCRSSELAASELGVGRFRLLYVDGAHDWDGIDRDLELVRELAAPDAIVVIDDVFHPDFPAVSARVWAEVARGVITPVVLSACKLYATLGPSPVGDELRRLVVEGGAPTTTHELDGAEFVRLATDEPDRPAASKRYARALTPPALYRAAGRTKNALRGRR
jgi:predicted O-methyltransferase YrrM